MEKSWLKYYLSEDVAAKDSKGETEVEPLDDETKFDIDGLPEGKKPKNSKNKESVADKIRNVLNEDSAEDEFENNTSEENNQESGGKDIVPRNNQQVAVRNNQQVAERDNQQVATRDNQQVSTEVKNEGENEDQNNSDKPVDWQSLVGWLKANGKEIKTDKIKVYKSKKANIKKEGDRIIIDAETISDEKPQEIVISLEDYLKSRQQLVDLAKNYKGDESVKKDLDIIATPSPETHGFGVSENAIVVFQPIAIVKEDGEVVAEIDPPKEQTIQGMNDTFNELEFIVGDSDMDSAIKPNELAKMKEFLESKVKESNLNKIASDMNNLSHQGSNMFASTKEKFVEISKLYNQIIKDFEEAIQEAGSGQTVDQSNQLENKPQEENNEATQQSTAA